MICLRLSFVPLSGTTEGAAWGWNALRPTRWYFGDAAPSPHLGPIRGGGAAVPTQRVGGNTLHLENGFTLLEILLALALMGMLAAVLVTGSANLLTDKPATPEAVFWKAVQQSRTAALTAEREVRLSYDPKTQAFVLDDGATAQSLAVPPTRQLTVDFLSTSAEQSSVLIGGELVNTQTIPAVTFYPDGTCSPFRVQFRTGGAANVLNIDPWTCAQVLPRTDATP